MTLEQNIISAIKRCEKEFVFDNNSKFSIYPFTTENISGYIEQFDLYDKSLLTVGSSSDQVINSILYGCKDITLVDINSYFKYYYYLKVASILCLDMDEFFYFLRYKSYPKTFKDNYAVFDLKIFDKIKLTLRLLDYESYLFFDELFQSYKGYDIRESMFSSDEYNTHIIKNCNNYLKDEKTYKKIKELITKIKPTFINDDLFKIKLKRKYDNIWLSNIGTYLSLPDLKILIDRMNLLLNNNGKLLVSYLFRTDKNTIYKDDWSIIYNLNKTFEVLKEYNIELKSFTGIDGFKFKDDNIKDSILVYKKIKENL